MKSNVERLVRVSLNRVAPKAAKAASIASWSALSPEERKQANESLVFISFMYETKLIADPFEHSNENQLRPDVLTYVDGCEYFFELGEVTDEALAKSIGDSMKTKTISGCAFSQEEPLAKMLKQKCEKRYETGGASVDLLLDFWRQSPYEETIVKYLNENSLEVDRLFLSSQFTKIWIYDLESETVLWKTQREKA
jgi:hypothetical protein